MKLKIKYFSDDMPRMEQIDKGNWVDLRANSFRCNGGESREVDKLEYEKGDIILIGLGVAMEIPKGFEALIAPRSSTFKNHKFIQVNSLGIIDTTYCGDNDEWFIQFIAMDRGVVNRFDRLAQFRLLESMPKLDIEEVYCLGNEDRGGHGSTGIK